MFSRLPGTSALHGDATAAIQHGAARGCSRRDFLARSAGGGGLWGLASLLASELHAEHGPHISINPVHPCAPRPPHFVAQAQRVIFLFQYGAPPHTDLYDYKPLLQQLHGQAVPDSFKQVSDKVGGVFNHCADKLLAAPFQFARHGESGLWFSDVLPNLARHADDICQIRSLTSESSNHAPATYQMNTGVILSGKPSFGSWVTYGLGSENQDLPGYVLLFQVGGLGGSANWSNGFLPAAFQGTRLRHEGEAMFDLRPPERFADVQRSSIDLVQALNRQHLAGRSHVPDLEGRIAAYELAYRMQSQAMRVGDLSGETKATLDLYGVDDKNPHKAAYARMCLMSRRLVERGVRVVQSYSAVDKLGWDGHEHNTDYVRRNAEQTDQPVAALLTDLKQRGLLDSTLVIWAGEFGRTPMEQGNGGRNHNPYGFTVWLAGGGTRGGQAIGATDDIGLRAVVNPHPVKDLHATVLHALGLRHEELFFEHDGRPERLTGVAGSARIIDGVLRA